MVVVKLMGGLGNQMFQAAAGRAAALDRGCPLYFDRSFLEKHDRDTEHFTARAFELDLFPGLADVPDEPGEVRRSREAAAPRRGFCARFFGRRAALCPWVTVTQHAAERVDIPADAANLYLDGYFQGERYFARHADAVRADFTFPAVDPADPAAALAAAILADTGSVSVHIRRGDYTKPTVAAVHDSVTMEYYDRAWSDLRRHLAGSPAVFVFSDDPAWAAANCRFPDAAAVTYVQGHTGRDSWKDMWLQSLCRHHIIANSSFSWWGAWLASPGGRNYAPRSWFNPGTMSFEITDIVPAGWTVINC